MFVGAVTGTNGKTSVVEMARALGQEAGLRTASIGTRGLVTPRGRHPELSLGGDREAMVRLLGDLESQGFEAVFFEAFSAALGRGLLDTVRLDAAAFTHLSADHHDVHGSHEEYRRAKARLFDRILPPGAQAIVNPAATAADMVLEAAETRNLKLITCGRDQDLNIDQERSILRWGDVAVPAKVPAWPDFVMSSVEIALVLARGAGADLKDLVQGLATIDLPPGRLQKVRDHPKVIVDYAHNPHGLATVLTYLRTVTAAKIWLVFGVGGGRESRASEMGAIARELADVVVITNDNPRHTSPARLRELLARECPLGTVIPDRRDAIRWAIGHAEGISDVVLIAGKGEEIAIDYGSRSLRHSDAAIARMAPGTVGAH